MTEWKPTLLYLTALFVCSLMIVISEYQGREAVKVELEQLVFESCEIAIEEQRDLTVAEYEAERESDAQFALTFARMEKKIDLLFSRYLEEHPPHHK